MSALLEPAQKGDVEKLRQLLKTGRAPDAITAAMFVAVSYGKAEAFALLLEAGGDPLARDEYGNSMLATAAGGGKESIVSALLARGADPNAVNQHGYTPLMNAVLCNRLKIAKILIAAGADISAQSTDEVGVTALKAAREHPKLVALLEGHGAKFDPRHEQKIANIKRRAEQARQHGNPPKFKQGEIGAFHTAARLGQIDVLRDLVAIGMPVDAATQPGQTACFWAISSGQLEAAQFLLEAGAKLEALAPESPMVSAAGGGNPDLVQLLLDLGHSPHDAGGSGDTPLIMAALGGHVEVARLLLQAGANMNQKSSSAVFRNKSAVDLARANRQKEIVKLFEEAGGPPDPAAFAYQASQGFLETSSKPAFQQMAKLVAEVAAQEPQPWKRRRGVLEYYFKNTAGLLRRYPDVAAAPDQQRTGQLTDRLIDEVRAGGFCLVRADFFSDNGVIRLRLFPTAEKYAVLLASGTNGVNYGHTTRDIISWLLDFEKENPFVLTDCWFDFLGGRALAPFQHADKWATQMLRFCPDIDTPPAALAAELTATGQIGFWWD
jgi:ankyrin repeat protein